MAAIAKESLRLRRAARRESALELVRKARRYANLGPAEADAIALEETVRHRAGRR